MRTPLIFALLALLLPAVSLAETTGQHLQEFEGTITRSVHIKYLLFIPDGYDDGDPKRWPLIMYLHGGSRRGDDIEKLREPGFGLTALVEKDEVEKAYAVDPARVYLTGHSMGGFGTWYLAYRHPERFAAIAPMSAPFTVTAWATRLKDMPIWAFHGAKDSLVPIGGDQELLEALKALGNVVRFTVLPGRDHDILDVYENQELYSWFLEHVRPVK
jgi:predicted peptidase